MKYLLYIIGGFVVLALLAVGLSFLVAEEAPTGPKDQQISEENLVAEINFERGQAGLPALKENQYLTAAAQALTQRLAAEGTDVSTAQAIVSLIDKAYPIDASKTEIGWILFRVSPSTGVSDMVRSKVAGDTTGMEVLKWTAGRSVGVGVTKGEDGLVYAAALVGFR